MTKASIVYVDDSAIVRKGVVSLFEFQEEFELVGVGSCGAEAISLALQKRPDLMLIDLKMPDLSGLEVIKCIKAHAPEMKTMILTAFDEKGDMEEAVRLGVDGYVQKDAMPETIFELIRAIIRGEYCLTIDDNAAKAPIAQDGKESESLFYVKDAPGKLKLTTREKETLELIAKNFTNDQIARLLFISETTVKSHVSNILNKLKQPNRSQAVLYALQQGIIQMKVPV